MPFWSKKKSSASASGPAVPAGSNADTEQLLRVIKKLMAMMVAADGDVEPAEIETMRKAFKDICGRELSVADVKNEIRLTDGDTNVERFLTRMKDKLDADDRKVVLKAAFAVASADGEVAEAEDALLERIVKALGMSDAEARSVIEG